MTKQIRGVGNGLVQRTGKPLNAWRVAAVTAMRRLIEAPLAEGAAIGLHSELLGLTVDGQIVATQSTEWTGDVVTQHVCRLLIHPGWPDFYNA
jgi:hypothetical protein